MNNIEFYIKQEKKYFTIGNEFINNYNKCVSIDNRKKLFDWLYQVCYVSDYDNHTYFLTVYVTDIYLNYSTIKLEELQLVGLTSLMIASKIEYGHDSKWFNISDCVDFCKAGYTVDEFRDMEINILSCVNFSLIIPSPSLFLNYFLDNNKYTKLYYLSHCLSLVSSKYPKFLDFQPSIIALSCIKLCATYFSFDCDCNKKLFSSILKKYKNIINNCNFNNNFYKNIDSSIDNYTNLLQNVIKMEKNTNYKSIHNVYKYSKRGSVSKFIYN